MLTTLSKQAYKSSIFFIRWSTLLNFLTLPQGKSEIAFASIPTVITKSKNSIFFAPPKILHSNNKCNQKWHSQTSSSQQKVYNFKTLIRKQCKDATICTWITRISNSKKRSKAKTIAKLLSKLNLKEINLSGFKMNLEVVNELVANLPSQLQKLDLSRNDLLGGQRVISEVSITQSPGAEHIRDKVVICSRREYSQPKSRSTKSSPLRPISIALHWTHLCYQVVNFLSSVFVKFHKLIEYDKDKFKVKSCKKYRQIL